jgi:hypothetical protein
VKKADKQPIEPFGNFHYFRKAFEILMLNRSTMQEIATDARALRFGLAVAACGGALSVLPRADFKMFLFFGCYSVAAIFLFAGFIHILAGYTKGKEHYMALIRISALASIADGLAAIPVLALLITLWGIVVSVVATEEIYEISKGKSCLYVLLSVAALWTITLLLLTGPFGSFYSKPGT